MSREEKARTSALKMAWWQRIAAMEKDLLDVEGAAALLGMSPRTISTLARKGEIPAPRVDRAWRFTR